jgi:predicted RecA/RadA family phage recombinase
MATAKYLRGDETTIEWLAPTTAGVAVGQIVVVGSVATTNRACLGVAKNAIAANTVGIVSITGCYLFPKVTGAAIAAGETVDWDNSANAIEDQLSSCVTGDIADCGIALAAAAAGSTSTTVPIMLRPGSSKTG